MLCRRVDALVPQRLLRFANVPLGELRVHEAPEIVRLSVMEAHLIGIALYGTPHVDR